MPFAVELFFDTHAEKQICDAWEAIQKAGIGSSLLDDGYRPHVSLSVCGRIDSTAFEAGLFSFAESVVPFPLSLSNVGVFPGAEGVVFLGVTVTEHLLDVHAAFHKIFKKYAGEQSEHYAVGKWVPHCTLAFGLSERQIAEAVSICRGIPLPISAEVKEIGLMDVSPNSCQTLCLRKLG
ncbi:MAG: 2'-5' RNA ligase family protein [Candidatus Poribacteria bacterium]|nr:2'-5' RNA ligase family protein [Candidatus Poribacteria bacterium]